MYPLIQASMSQRRYLREEQTEGRKRSEEMDSEEKQRERKTFKCSFAEENVTLEKGKIIMEERMALWECTPD